jgi:hypothetical protein
MCFAKYNERNSFVFFWVGQGRRKFAWKMVEGDEEKYEDINPEKGQNRSM